MFALNLFLKLHWGRREIALWIKALPRDEAAVDLDWFRTKNAVMFRYQLLENVKTLTDVQLLCFWTLSVTQLLFKTHEVSETTFYLRLKVEPAQMGSINTGST
jgi:hypothetical protein